jgi:hypothetical protein
MPEAQTCTAPPRSLIKVPETAPVLLVLHADLQQPQSHWLSNNSPESDYVLLSSQTQTTTLPLSPNQCVQFT